MEENLFVKKVHTYTTANLALASQPSLPDEATITRFIVLVVYKFE